MPDATNGFTVLMDFPRYIVLGDTIIDREKIVLIYRDEKLPGRVHVEFTGIESHHFDGGDAVTLWRLFDTDAGWREPETR